MAKTKYVPKKSNKSYKKPKIYQSCAMDLTKPPKRDALIYKRHVFRFIASSAYSGDILASDIAGALGGVVTVANSNLTCYNLGFRINSVEAWASGTQTTPATATITWGAGDTSNAAPFTGTGGGCFLPKTIMDTSVGVSLAAHFKSFPPKRSLCGEWIMLQQGAASGQFTSTCFSLNVTQGAVVDLDVSYVEQSGLDYSNVDVSIVSGGLQDIFYLALDGPTSNKLVPVNMLTTH